MQSKLCLHSSQKLQYKLYLWKYNLPWFQTESNRQSNHSENIHIICFDCPMDSQTSIQFSFFHVNRIPPRNPWPSASPPPLPAWKVKTIKFTVLIIPMGLDLRVGNLSMKETLFWKLGSQFGSFHLCRF